MGTKYFSRRVVNNEQCQSFENPIFPPFSVSRRKLVIFVDLSIRCERGFWKLTGFPLRKDLFLEDVCCDVSKIFSLSAISNSSILPGFAEYCD
jgi:hypothetical protein